jgi:hypothetical protein
MRQNELQHYGVPGMRWGIRRASKKLSSSSSTDESILMVRRNQNGIFR